MFKYEANFQKVAQLTVRPVKLSSMLRGKRNISRIPVSVFKDFCVDKCLEVKHGCTRVVYIFDYFVVKFPSYKSARQCNINEAKLSGKHPDLARVLYCAPLGEYLIMEKAKPVGNTIPDWNEFQNVVLEKKYANDPFKRVLMEDSHKNNWGYVKNRLVCIDYVDYRNMNV